MRFPTFFFISILFVIAALISHFGALRFAADATHLRRPAMGIPAEQERIRPQIVSLDRDARMAFRIGIGCACISGLSLFVSYRKRESSAPRFIVLVLFFFYGVLQFAVV
jgi:hypothetical protein